MLDKLGALWRANPVRGAAFITAAIVFLAAKFGVILDKASVLHAVVTGVPFLLGGEVARTHVIPIHKLVTDHTKLPPDEVNKKPKGLVEPDTIKLAVSGGPRLKLNIAQRVRVRTRIVAAAYVMYRHSALCNYTQGPERWQGIAHHLRAYKGQFPTESDCSSSSSWEDWDATRRYKLPDFLNGQNWGGGYTGTAQQHGVRIKVRTFRGKPINLLPGDKIFYGDQGGGIAEHMATYVGKGYVLSHGGAGMHLLPWDYRAINECRRYVR